MLPHRPSLLVPLSPSELQVVTLKKVSVISWAAPGRNTRLKLKYLQPDLFSFSDLFSSCCSVLCCMCCCCCGVVCLVLRAACTYILRIFPSKRLSFFPKNHFTFNSTGRRTAHSPPRKYMLSEYAVCFCGRACDLVLRICAKYS